MYLFSLDLPIYASVYLRGSAPHLTKCNGSEYHYVIVALKYPAIVSQSDIALVTSVSALFNQGLLMKYMSATKGVLKYLKTTCNMAIHYPWSENLNLVGYCDGSFGLHTVEAVILSHVCTLA
ncbi:hypothetical protein GGF37_002169 [Kickxella alabastrina]|nr:hypothetical protein GGF37_002169 [Kickxella alabastrina]